MRAAPFMIEVPILNFYSQPNRIQHTLNAGLPGFVWWTIPRCFNSRFRLDQSIYKYWDSLYKDPVLERDGAPAPLARLSL
jgi:hypothetical protein